MASIILSIVFLSSSAKVRGNDETNVDDGDKEEGGEEREEREERDEREEEDERDEREEDEGQEEEEEEEREERDERDEREEEDEEDEEEEEEERDGCNDLNAVDVKQAEGGMSTEVLGTKHDNKSSPRGWVAKGASTSSPLASWRKYQTSSNVLPSPFISAWICSTKARPQGVVRIA